MLHHLSKVDHITHMFHSKLELLPFLLELLSALGQVLDIYEPLFNHVVDLVSEKLVFKVILGGLVQANIVDSEHHNLLHPNELKCKHGIETTNGRT